MRPTPGLPARTQWGAGVVTSQHNECGPPVPHSSNATSCVRQVLQMVLGLATT